MIGDTFMIKCNNDCKSGTKKVVKGSSVYTADTPICKAGTHSKVLVKTRAG